MDRGPPRFDGERRFGGDRDGYRGGPRGPAGEFGGDKGGAPADYRPSFGVIILLDYCFISMKFECCVCYDLVYSFRYNDDSIYHDFIYSFRYNDDSVWFIL